MQVDSIGNVVLDYSFYSSDNIYSDGDETENLMFDIAKSEAWEDKLKNSNEWPILYHFSNLRWNLLEWLPFDKSDEVLEIGAGCGALTGLLAEKTGKVTCIELSKRRSEINAYRNKQYGNIEIFVGNFQDIKIDKRFDYVTLIGVLEYSNFYIKSEEPFLEMIKKAKSYLKEDGKLIIAIENKMGLKYWNGAPEDHTGKIYGGLNDYVDGREERTFSKPELINLLENGGFDSHHFYYPIPDYKLPNMVFSDSYLPDPGAVRTYRKNYSAPRIYNFFEDTVTDQLCADNMLQYFANSFLVICGNDSENVDYVVYSRERKPEFRIKTEILDNVDNRKTVVRSPLNSKAQKHINQMAENRTKWEKILENVSCAEGELVGDNYVESFISGKGLEAIMYDYRNNAKAFLEKTREILRQYLTPKEDELVNFKITNDYIEVFGENYLDNTYSSKCTNVDILFQNLKMDQYGKLYAFDFEWIFDFPIPYRYPLWRVAKELYYKFKPQLIRRFDVELFTSELGFTGEERKVFWEMEKAFSDYVCGKNQEEVYTKRYVKPSIMQYAKFC